MTETLTASEALTLLVQTRDAMDAYKDTLPAWVQWWMHWMKLVLAPSLILAWWHIEARFVALAIIYAKLTGIFISAFSGIGPLWGLAHLLFWTPTAIYCSTRLLAFRTLRSPYAVWLCVATLTMWVSLGFDTLDVARFFLRT